MTYAETRYVLNTIKGALDTREGLYNYLSYTMYSLRDTRTTDKYFYTLGIGFLQADDSGKFLRCLVIHICFAGGEQGI